MSRQQRKCRSARMPGVVRFRGPQSLFDPDQSNGDFADDEKEEDGAEHSTTHKIQGSRHHSVPKRKEIPPEVVAKMSSLERLYTENLFDLLNTIKPHYISSESVDIIQKEYFHFPAFQKVCEKIKKHPLVLFRNIQHIDIQCYGFGYWLSLKTNEPAFRRQKLEHEELINILMEDTEIDLKYYKKENQTADEVFFEYMQNTRGIRYDSFIDQLDEQKIIEERKKKAANEKNSDDDERHDDSIIRQRMGLTVAEEEKEDEKDADLESTVAQVDVKEVRDVRLYTYTTNENRMLIFRDIFNIEDEYKLRPEAKDFVGGEKAMAKFFLSEKFMAGMRVPGDPRFHLHYDYIMSILKDNGITYLNELQRLIAYLVQRSYLGKRMFLNNLLICAESFRGFKTAICAVLFKNVVGYKCLNENGEAPQELLYNRNPYVLIIGLEEADCIPIYNIIERYLRGGCHISMPHTFCTNAKLRKNLEGGCDILVVDRKKLDFIRSGEIDLCNLRHVVFLNVEMFTDNHEIHLRDVHQVIQTCLAKMQCQNKDLAEETLNVQYIFQTYQLFRNWETFERLFYFTQPICDNLGLVINHDYVDRSKETQN